MAAGGSWNDDEILAEDHRNHVFKNFHRSEILDFMHRDYPLERRLRFFDIFYIDHEHQWKQFKKQ